VPALLAQKDSTYVLNHCTKYLPRDDTDARHDYGQRQLERVVRNNRLQPASELSRQVLSELQRWRPAAVNQQDDITLIVVDVL
jgi:Stage II sporulation protein E (SpoIIE)